MKTKFKFFNYFFDKYIADALAKSQSHELKYLDNREKGMLFVKNYEKYGLEEKLWLLGKLGHRFAILVAPRETILAEQEKKGLSWTNIKKALKIFRKKAESHEVKELADLGAFAIAEQSFMQSLTLISTIYNSKSYELVRDYEKIAEYIDRIQYNKLLTTTSTMMQSISLLDDIIITAMNIGAEKKQERFIFADKFNLTYESFRMLSFLSRSGVLVKREDLLAGASITEITFNRILADMTDLNYVEKHPTTTGVGYTITGLGEVALNNARNYILQQHI